MTRLAAPAEPHLRRIALGSLLLLPLALLHGRAVAEILTSLIGIAFLLHCALAGDWAWLRRPWLALPLLFWAWIVLCTACGPWGQKAVVQAVVALRYWMLLPALEIWLLRPGLLHASLARRWLWLLVAASLAWIGAQCWLQYLVGVNLFGWPRWGDGALTGPFYGPRAGSPYALLLYPALLPPVMALLGRPRWPARLAGVGLAMLGIATLILIGQRMPALLGLFGLGVAGLLLPRFRPAVLAALALGVALVAALPVVSPPAYQKLVVRFLDQMGHFPTSDYGQIYIRAATMVEGRPGLGFGILGFREACADPRWAAAPALDVPQLRNPDGTSAGCALHPHNFWLEAAVDGGLPGLVLFAAVCGLILWRAGGRLGGDPLRVGLFAAVLVKLWPLAATNSFYAQPMAGWSFLVIGWALALRADAPGQAHRP